MMKFTLLEVLLVHPQHTFKSLTIHFIQAEPLQLIVVVQLDLEDKIMDFSSKGSKNRLF